MLESMAEQSDQRSQLYTSAPVVESQPVVMLPEDVKLRRKTTGDDGSAAHHAVISNEENVDAGPDVDVKKASANSASNRTMKHVLSVKQYKRRQMYKRSWKMLMRAMEDWDSEDSGLESDDYISDDHDNDQRDNLKCDRVVESIKCKDTRSDIVEKSEFYKYPHWHGGARVPRLDKRVSGTVKVESVNERADAHSAVFTKTTMYALANNPQLMFMSSSEPYKVLGVVGTYITIKSETILKAIRSIVRFYPGLSAFSKPLHVREPFCMLRHYQSELEQYSESMLQGQQSGNRKHMSSLLDFLRQSKGAEADEELKRFSEKGVCSFNWAWLLFKPGNIVYYWDRSHRSVFSGEKSWDWSVRSVLRAAVVESHSRETDTRNPENLKPPILSGQGDFDELLLPKPLEITAWTMDFNGRVLGRLRRVFSIQPFGGEKAITSLECFPKEFLITDKNVDPDKSTHEALIERGKRFVELTKRSYMEYEGETMDFRAEKISSRVMVDLKYYYDYIGPSRNVFPPDLVNTKSDAAKMRVQRLDMYNQAHDDFYDRWDDISPFKAKNLSDEHYMVCSHRVDGFVFTTRKWELLDCSRVFPIRQRPDVMRDLVLREDMKSIVNALSRRCDPGNLDNRPFRADFIQNKGEGQIFLLHGRPGVGKTTTAECVAENTGRPLLSLTCGDLGVEPIDVEQNLNKWLHMATLWDAVLLLDEAEVYFESRIVQDLQRNSLVSIFLRALQYHKGILFLTTNRVGTLDDAFFSRMHVTIHYPDFTDAQRAQIWDIFFGNLELDENFRIMPSTIDYAKTSEEVLKLNWNGRQIRNAFNTAVALAEYDNQRDKGRIMLKRSHLEQVVKMNQAFREYISSVHGADVEVRAKKYMLRNEPYQRGEASKSP